MKNVTATNPAYRKVVAALSDCEERYDGLVRSLGGTKDSRLESTISTLKREIELRRGIEVELLTAVETERQRIGQDLHDDLCQRLGATALLLGSLAKKISALDPGLAEQMAQVPKQLNETIESCRNIARGLHPVTLHSEGLPAALQELASRVPAGVHFEWPHTKRIDFEDDIALHLYRIAEEAVGNALKHGDASDVKIKLGIIDRRPILEIHNDGKDFDQKANGKGMGLRNMQYRANVIGASLAIEPRADGGTCVRCTLPARSEEEQ